MSEAVKIAADVLSERARLKKGGECVRYAAIVIQALEDAGYRVVKQERIGWSPVGTDEAWADSYASPPKNIEVVLVWRDLS